MMHDDKKSYNKKFMWYFHLIVCKVNLFQVVNVSSKGKKKEKEFHKEKFYVKNVLPIKALMFNFLW